MAPSAERYVEQVAALVGADRPGFDRLRAAARELDDKIANAALAPAAADDAIRVWQQCQEAVWGDLRRAILRSVPLPEFERQARAAGWSAPGGLRLDATLGPLVLAARAEPYRLLDPRGGVVVLGPVGVGDVSVRLNAGPVKADGRIAIPGWVGQELRGRLSADLDLVKASALIALRETSAEPTFLCVLAAAFTPAVQLGLGFRLDRVGGVVGIERRVDSAVLAARLADGSAMAALFPLDAGPSAVAALDVAGALFPAAPGSAFAGPTFRLSWLQIAGRAFMSADLGLVLELPGPRRAYLVGVVRAGVHPVLRLRANIAGVLDVPARIATVDAALVDSGALGVFTIHGDLAFATCWGPQSYTVVSLGGFYPGFWPEPAKLRPLRRLGMALDTPAPGLRLRAEGYLAATANTVQLGGSLEVAVDAGIASISGFVDANALVQFTPFHVRANLNAGLRVRFLGRTFAGVRFDGMLDGPEPLTLNGQVTVETFFKDFSWSDTFSFGSGGGPPHVVPERPAKAVAAQVGPHTLRSREGRDPGVVLSPPERDGKLAVISPMGGLLWSQRRLPLQTHVDRVDGAELGWVARVTVRESPGSHVSVTGAIRERFAPGTFRTLTESQALNGPIYELLPSGVEVAGNGYVVGPMATGMSNPYLVKKIGGGKLWDLAGSSGTVFPGAVLSMVLERDQPAAVATLTPQIEIEPKRWHAVGKEFDTHTQAMFAGMTVTSGPAMHRFPLSNVDKRRPVELAGL